MHFESRGKRRAARVESTNLAIVAVLEPRRLLAGVDGGVLAIQTDNVVRAPAGYAETWQPLAEVAKPSRNAVSHLNVGEFDAFRLDEKDLRATLKLAPLEFTPAATRPVEVSLPTPDGSAARFAVVETQLMAPKLAAKFPGIKTYRGVGLSDPAASIRLDLTPAGFHAQVISPGKTFYVDPYWHRSTSTYASYWRRDVDADEELLRTFADDVDHAHDSVGGTGHATGDGTITGEGARTSGTTLRTFRAAVAATGEYTQFHGGTVALGQAAIVTAVNRVSGIYESELAIRLQLVANNNALVFTNAGTDPYTNNDPDALLDQNQARIDSVIGSANYDIGHVFGTGGGGLAGLGVVGINGQKAWGETGSGSPVGDAFYVDYVAHEMGHQFGAEHTFNTSSAGSNRNASTAYEPGSGTTIMGYAGITGNNSDLATNSDPYFAFVSLDEIIAHVDDVIPSVGTRVSTGNSIPTVNAGIDRTIPTGTPFSLTATGSDANGDTLTYSWEQADLGAARLLNATDNGASPLFRVYNPTTSPTRTFPKLESILAGSPTTAAPFGGFAERLPTVARPSMDFRVTVRDNRAGGGAVNHDQMVVNVVNTGSAFLVTSHNSGVGTLAGGSLQTVTWSVAGTTANGINAANVNIRLSTDGGQTFPTLLASNVANDGSESVQLPFNTGTTTARIKVEPTNNIFFDINNTNFTITNVPNVPTSATPGTPNLNASYDSGLSTGDNITYRDNSAAGKTLQFTVTGTVSGATVSIYANGSTLIGSAVASGTSTVVLTNGTLDLADGVRPITARQTEPGKAESAASAALNVTIDTTAPTVGIANVSPDPRTTPVDSFAVTFSENVFNFDWTDLSLKRDGITVPLSATNAPTGGPASFTAPNFTTPTTRTGAYTFSVTNAAVSESTAITDVAGNSIPVIAATESWVNNAPLPTVTNVFVGSTAWAPAYRSLLAITGDGEAAFGYRIKANEQTRTLGWSNLDQISVRFSKDVAVAADDLVLNGVNLATYALAPTSNFAYDPATFTATWTLAQPIRNDKITLRIDAGETTGVRDAIGNPLDGDWANPTFPALSADTLPSGNGVAGGSFDFDLRILPGDVNRDGNVNVYDYNVLRPKLNQSNQGVAAGDINGDNLVSVVDYNELRTYLNQSSPG